MNVSNEQEKNEISSDPEEIMISLEQSALKDLPANTRIKNPVFVSQLKLKQTGKIWHLVQHEEVIKMKSPNQELVYFVGLL